MKCNGILNPNIISEIAKIGHTQSIVIGDCGLPVPKGVRVIDISLVAGIPSFLDVLNAVRGELVIEKAVIASEMEQENPAVYGKVAQWLKNVSLSVCAHEDFKKLTENANCIIRTGENTSYANIILYGGVNF